ncbi:MAG: biotin--[acetyl-CoA-carboxylase] ligase [Eubacteriales bacterium]
MKSEILKLLREAEDYISGQELCDKFTVSRTAVWKVINQLKEDGYSIEAVRNKGYRMIDSPDVLNREAVESHVGSKSLGCQVVCFDVIDSTNIQAKVLAEQGCPHGMLVVADQQVSGKGRRGRTWESPKASAISMSLVLRPTFAPNRAPMLTLIMAYSVAKAMLKYEHAKWNVQIKWPNDIVVNGKKVCGILTEMSTEVDYINYVVIGVGINANMTEFPEELENIATSLKLESLEPIMADEQAEKLTEESSDARISTNYIIQRAKLIGMILEEFEVQYEQFCEMGDLSFLQEGYNELLVNRDKEVKVLEPGNEYKAFARGIDSEGQLEVCLESGEVKSVYAGEVSVRGLYGYV